MNKDDDVALGAAHSVEALRDAFDAPFSKPQPARQLAAASFLVARAQGLLFALELGGLVEVRPATRVAAVPSTVPAFLGMANLDGTLYPVWDLGCVLTGQLSPPLHQHWLLVPRFTQTAALSVECADKQVRVSEGSVQDSTQDHWGGLTKACVFVNEQIPVLDLRKVVARIQTQTGPSKTTGETAE